MSSSHMMNHRSLLLVLTVANVGCAALTGNEEMSLYRAIRYETDNERRTHLGSEYVSRFPNGRFIAQMRVEVD